MTEIVLAFFLKKNVYCKDGINSLLVPDGTIIGTISKKVQH